MSCDEVRPLLREATRGGLDEAARARVYAHLASCEACQKIADEERALDRLLEERLPQHPASLALKRRLQARLPAAETAAPSAAPVRRARARWLAPLGGALAACAALVFVLGRGHPAGNPLVTEAVADHLRVVYRERPVDIEGGGPHQVKPWFTGRLDFALPAVFGGDDEFKLEGGSVGYYLDRKAAVLVYKRGAHTASLFVFRADGLGFPASNRDLGGTPAAVREERGFRVAVWRAGQLGYALVSDLGADELDRLGARIAGASR